MEATEVFFAVTKLFQSKDVSLRRMVYLIIKELSPSSDEVINVLLNITILEKNFQMKDLSFSSAGNLTAFVQYIAGHNCY